MEKYRSSADPSTGIHPFMPPKAPLHLHAKPLILVRLPLLVLTLLLYVPACAFCRLVPIKAVSYWLQRLTDILYQPMLLCCLSVWRLHPPVVERPRTRPAVSSLSVAHEGDTNPKSTTKTSSSNKGKSNPATASPSYPRRGDVIVCNHCSPLDLLYLTRYFSPVFAVPTFQLPTSASSPAAQSPVVVPLSLMAALRRVSCAPAPIPASHPRATRLSDLCRERRAPVVLLAEGCATNGAGVLQFALPFDAMPGPMEAPKLFALGFAYSRGRSETRPLGGPSSLVKSLFFFVTRPAAHIYTRMTAICPTDMKHLQRTVANLAGNAPLSIGYEAGLKFAQHWAKTH